MHNQSVYDHRRSIHRTPFFEIINVVEQYFAQEYLYYSFQFTVNIRIFRLFTNAIDTS